MTSVRFLYTSQPGKGFREFINPDQGVKNWLKGDLKQPHSASHTRTLSKGLSVSLQDGLIICTFLSQQRDDNGRPFIRNHSVLLPESEYNRLARNFDQSILTHLLKEDEEAIEDDQLRPLALPNVATNGLSKEELKKLGDYLGGALEQLLASLIDGKPFSIGIRGNPDDAIALVIVLLKIAALGNLPVPQISTYEPAPRTRAWYPSQVLPVSQGRAATQFQRKDTLGKAATELCERLMQSVRNLDPEGIESAIRTGRNHSEVQRNDPPKTVAVPTAAVAIARKGKKGEDSRASDEGNRLYQYNKDYEAALNSTKKELDDQREKLNEQEIELLARERNVGLRESDVREVEDDLKKKDADLRQWKHIYEIFSVLDKSDSQKLEEQVLDKFFDEIKRLSPDILRTLDDGVNKFLPNLEEIANRYEPKGNRFLRNVKDVEKKLETKDSRGR